LSEATARARARVAAAAGADPRRAALERSLASRFWLRFHMSVMRLLQERRLKSSIECLKRQQTAAQQFRA